MTVDDQADELPPEFVGFPRDTYVNTLKQASLGLTDEQLAGVGILTTELAEKWYEAERRADADHHHQLLTELTVLRLGQEGGALTASLSAHIVPMLAEALVGWFKEHGGKNYVEMKGEWTIEDAIKAREDPDLDPAQKAEVIFRSSLGPMAFTVQRLLGKSPNDLRLEAEAKLQAIRDLLDRAEQNPLEHPSDHGESAYVCVACLRDLLK